MAGESLHISLPTYTTELPTFHDAYSQYADLRNTLHVAELQGQTELARQLLPRVMASKEEVALHALGLWAKSNSPKVFVNEVTTLLNTHPAAQEDALRMGVDEPYFGAYLMPLSTEQEELASPVESIMATAVNLEVATLFAEVGRNHAQGMLLLGSSAWGSFFAVRGGPPQELHDDNPEAPYYQTRSDIDLLVTGTIEELEATLYAYIEAGLLSDTEGRRFERFKTLHNQGVADIFSLRDYGNDVEKSLHFVPLEIIEDIADGKVRNPKTIEKGLLINTVNDFRPNLPKKGGYPIEDISSNNTFTYPAETEAIKDTNDQILGYISTSPIGGRIEVDGRSTYATGIFTSFLAAHPVVLVDKQGALSQCMQRLQHTVATALDGRPVVNVARKERMTRAVFDAIQTGLSIDGGTTHGSKAA